MIDVLPFILFGFVAQLIDGALGMAYGVSANTLLLALGLPPALASASVHTAEIFTTGVSGLSHKKFGNVDKKLFLSLLIPGMIGGAVGAYILVNIDGTVIKPYVNGYLVVMGLIILARAIWQKRVKTKLPIPALGLVGGIFDAIGGGGWGPVVTGTLFASSEMPGNKTIGSVNAAEFFVTVTESVMFFITLGVLNWHAVIGLLIGGVIAAPFAAFVCAKIPTRLLMGLVGTLVVIVSLKGLLGL
jgi:uncharacterized membrane protein YfcA